MEGRERRGKGKERERRSGWGKRVEGGCLSRGGSRMMGGSGFMPELNMVSNDGA